MLRKKNQTEEVPQEETSKALVNQKNEIQPLENYSDAEIAELTKTTGLEDLPMERRRMPLIAWNLDFRDEMGNDVRPDMFYNCQSGNIQQKVNCALVYIKETFARVHRDKETHTKTLMCRSFDCVWGEPVPSDTNPNPPKIECAKCGYRRAAKGKRKPCSTVQRVIAWNLDEQEPFVFNVASTSFIPFQTYLERNFFNKIKRGNKRFDIPLYMLRTVLDLKEETAAEGSRYWILNPICEGPLPKNIVIDLIEVAKAAQNIVRKEIEIETPDTRGVEQPQTEASAEANENVSNVSDDDVPF